MKTHSIIILLIPLLVLSTGCTTLKRYKSVKTSGIDSTIADVDLFGIRLSRAIQEKGSKTLWDLSADAQSQFIKILNSRFPDNEKFLNSLSFEYMNGKEELLPNDYVSKDLRLIFSVSKSRDYSKERVFPGSKLSQADRIEYLKISLEIPENSCLRFTGWNMYTTEYGSVDIADISFSRTVDLDASASLSAKKEVVGGDVSAGAKSSISRKEDQAVKYRYIKLNGRINEKQIEMEEEGTREIDLTGNIIADVSLEFNKFQEVLTSISGLKDTTGRFNDAGKLVLHYSEVVVPGIEEKPEDIKAILKMEYVYRNVSRGRRTFPEWDDRVKYYTGNKKKSITLLSKNDFMPHFYSIGIDGPQKELVKRKDAADRLYELKFGTYKEASDFYEWLKYYSGIKEHQGKAINIGGQTLTFKSNDLTNEQINGDSRFRVLSYY